MPPTIKLTVGTELPALKPPPATSPAASATRAAAVTNFNNLVDILFSFLA